jgi:hypothetical protein
MKKRRLALAGPILLLMLTLSGCFFRSVDQLYTVPQPSKDYEALQVCLSQVVDQGGEYAAPLTGEMIQSVQLQDLDGDGEQEAIAFFRLANEQKPMKIYIFHRDGDAYETMAVIEGAATAINSVDYVQMNDDPVKEIVVSWQMTAQVRSLAVYSVGPQQVEELVRTDYDGYEVYDLDQDSQQELVVFRTPAGSVPQAELYDFDGGGISLAGTAPFSTGAVTGADGGVKTDYLSTVRTGYLTDRVPAIFTVSSYGEGGTITDIFACQNGELRNITLDPETGESGETVRYYTQVAETDINGDGIMEIPQPVPLTDYKVTGDGVNFWLIRWQQFDREGHATKVYTTYHNVRDGWYFVLPDRWGENLTLSRSDLAGGGERAVTFSYWEGDESVEPIPFLTIYKLTGSNRVNRSRMGDRFILLGGSGAETIYAAEFKEGWDSGLDQEDVRDRFATIKTDWYNG